MSIKINYKSSFSKKLSSNLVLFTNKKFNIDNIKKNISNTEFSYIKDLLKSSDLKKNILDFDLNSKNKIILINIKDKSNSSDVENLGAELYDFIKARKITNIFINSQSLKAKPGRDFIGRFLHGLKLKSYEFNKYKTKKEKKEININIYGYKIKSSSQNKLKFRALEEGTFFARDLVSEPGNILHPDEYAKRINSLNKIGLKINIYDEKKLKKLGMNALLGVGQGSIRGSYLITMEWNGAKNDCYSSWFNDEPCIKKIKN